MSSHQFTSEELRIVSLSLSSRLANGFTTYKKSTKLLIPHWINSTKKLGIYLESNNNKVNRIEEKIYIILQQHWSNRKKTPKGGMSRKGSCELREFQFFCEERKAKSVDLKQAAISRKTPEGFKMEIESGERNKGIARIQVWERERSVWILKWGNSFRGSISQTIHYSTSFKHERETESTYVNLRRKQTLP